MKFICGYLLHYTPLCATTCHYTSLRATMHPTRPTRLYAPLHSVCFCLHSAGLIPPDYVGQVLFRKMQTYLEFIRP